ncbi:host attachment protein [Methylovulum psychrotolerans]|uniref:Host attachment protein n=1 Tax=Methylovulum psychrotolerans TaxID=1704499 RepID=A0A2S5CKS2_9GAMM|nr:host attachment protein [Methylovulum psychrotolerans]POZ51411.1 host attachment protein [Methylovulum psychrotolerans]
MKLTWIIVADNTQARIFTAETPSSALIELEGLGHAEGRLHDRDITSDLPGRIKSTDGSAHAFEQATDPKHHEADLFAHTIAALLESAHNDNQFGQLLIIAEPSLLGLLRHCLPESVQKAVTFELAKNIASHSLADIRTHLPEYLPNA